MLKVGLTGGISCGKSTVCTLFREHGVPVVDTDELAREVVSRGSTVLSALVNLFGKEILQVDGALDRARMREIVFKDSEKRQQLEALTHPAIRSLLQARLSQLDSPYAIIAVPLLLEKQWNTLVDRILVVDCSEAQQIERAMARDGNSKQLITAIIHSQLPRYDRLEQADDIIHNDGDLDVLYPQVEKLHQYYTSIASNI